MLDIIKDLHLTVENIVAGTALISQNSCSNEAFTWEIINGSNQPTVTISYKPLIEDDVSCKNKLPFYGEINSELQSVNDSSTEINEGMNFPSSAEQEPHVMSSSSIQEEQEFSQNIFEPLMCIKVKKESSIEFDTINLNDQFQEESGPKIGVILCSSNIIHINEDENVAINSNDDELNKHYSDTQSSGYLVPREDSSLSIHPVIKIKEENETELGSFCRKNKSISKVIQTCDSHKICDINLTNKNNQLILSRKNTNSKEFLSNIENKKNYNKFIGNNGDISHLNVNTKKENRLISSEEEIHNHLIITSSRELNCPDADVFKPEIILNTEISEHIDNANNITRMKELLKMESSHKNLRNPLLDSNYVVIEDSVNSKQNEKSFKSITYKKNFKQKRPHTSEQTFPCDYCGKCFRNAYGKRKHQTVHTGEKPFACSYCNKGFARNHDKRRHERTHTGEKPYSCSYCDRRFNQICSRNTHENNSCKKRRCDDGL